MWKLLEANVGVLGRFCPLLVCQQPEGGVEMFLYVSETSKMDLVHGALIEGEILISPFPNIFAQLGPVCWD